MAIYYRWTKPPKHKNIKKRYSEPTKPSKINKRYKTNKKDKERKGSFYKKDSENKPKKKNIKCYKCGKIGHYANRCHTKKKIKEIKDEDLRRTLLKIMINSDQDFTSEEDQSSTSSKEDNCHDVKVNVAHLII